MTDVRDECGVAAIYHLPGRGVPVRSVPSKGPKKPPAWCRGCCWTSRTAANWPPDVTTYQSPPQATNRYLQGCRLGQRGLSHESSGQYENLMKEYAAGRPSATSAMPPAAATTAVTPSLSSGTTSRNTSGSASPSTASWPTIAEAARAELLADDNNHLARETDTEIFMHQICQALSADRQPPLIDVCGRLPGSFDGAYSLVFLDALGDMMVARDPLGIKPLCYAIEGPLFAAASESVALMNMGFAPESIKPFRPARRSSSATGVWRFRPSPQSCAGPLFLRVGLFRQRGQHAGRPQRLPGPQGPGRGIGPAWRRCRSTRTRSSCPCPTPARPRPTPWPTR
jgi:amidophosphoribosyltransferase